MKTYSYVVDHDLGYAPNPDKGICTLVQCKFRGNSRNRNIVELAEVSDIIIGTGGNSTLSTGQGTIVYVMKVTEKIPFRAYLTLSRYKGRVDCRDNHEGNEYALISTEFIYFGKQAISIKSLPQKFGRIEKEGPWFKVLKPGKIGSDLLRFLITNYGKGMKGTPKSNVYGMHPTRQCSRPAGPTADC